MPMRGAAVPCPLWLDHPGGAGFYRAMTMPPTLQTDRLILRPHRISDFPQACLLWSDGEVVRHIGGSPQDAQAVWYRLLRYAGMWSWLGC